MGILLEVERRDARSKGRTRGPAPWWLIGAGLAAAALAVALLVAPSGRAPSAHSSIGAGARGSSEAELTDALRTRSSTVEIAGMADVQIRGLGGALEARRGGAGRVVVEYRADASPRQLRAVTFVAARRLARVMVAFDVAAAERDVAGAQARLERADAAIADHQVATGVEDPDLALADSREQLSSLQGQRDRAVAAGSASVATLEQQVAVAQQEMFDLEALATRRADLVDARDRAAAGAGTAAATQQAAAERVASVAGIEPRVTVADDPGPPAWRVALAGVLGLLGVVMIVVGVVALLRTRRPRARSRSRAPAAQRPAGSADAVAARAAVPPAAPPAAPPAPARPEPSTLLPAPRADRVPTEPASPAPVVADAPPPAPSPGTRGDEAVLPEVAKTDLTGKPRIELDEIERRLAALQDRASDPGDVDGGPRIDQRT